MVVGGSQEFYNLYAGGGSVVVSKQIFGDLFAGGGSVLIAGPVEKDLFAAGGSVTVSHPVGDDARLAGGSVVVNAPIAGDLLIAGGTVALSENAHIGRDFWAAGGIVNLNGTVGGGAKITGGDIFINGVINGPLQVRAGKKLVFGPQSRVNGPIAYAGRREAVVENGAQIGQIAFTPAYGKTRYAPATVLVGLGFFFLLKLAALLAASLVLLKFFRRMSLAIVSSACHQFWQNLGIGFVGIIAIPLAAILLMATLVGAYLGVIIGIWFAFSLLMAGIATITLAGCLAQTWINKTKGIALSWETPVWGVLVLGVLDIIPFIGWLAIAVLYLAAFGSVLRTARKQLEI